MQICVSIPSICPLQTLHKNPWILLPIGRRCVPVMEKPIVWRSGKRLRTAMCPTWQPLTTVAHHSHLTGFHDIYGIYGLICEWAYSGIASLHCGWTSRLVCWQPDPRANVSASTVRDGTASVYHRFLTVSYTTLYFASEFPTFCENEDEDEQNEHDDEHYVEHEDEDEDETMMTMMMMRRRRRARIKKKKKRKRRRRKRRKKKKEKKEKEKKEKKEEKRRRRLRMRMKINRMKKQKKKKKDIMMIMNTIPALDPPLQPFWASLQFWEVHLQQRPLGETDSNQRPRPGKRDPKQPHLSPCCLVRLDVSRLYPEILESGFPKQRCFMMFQMSQWWPRENIQHFFLVFSQI